MMKKCCSTYLFLTYISGTIIFLLFGILAITGNPVLIMEHYIYDDNQEVTAEEKKAVKSRVYSQYFFSSFLCLIFSLAIFLIFLRDKRKPTSETIDTFFDSNLIEPKIGNEIEGVPKPVEFSNTNNDSINNISGSLGMSERESVAEQ